LNFFSLFKRNLIYKIKKKILIDSDEVNSETLDKIFHYYGSDKANIFKKTQDKGHGYSIFYEKKFEKLKNNKINILEIGSYSGASAAAFAKYFSDSNIFCFDINISNFKYKSKNIHVFGLDINNEKKVKKTFDKIFLKYGIKNFDIIIDDGSHNLSDILFGLKLFYHLVKKNGLYVIEDFKHPNYYQYNNNIDHIFIDEFLKNLDNKKISASTIISKNEQINLMKSIENMEIFKGNLSDSDICFITKR